MPARGGIDRAKLAGKRGHTIDGFGFAAGEMTDGASMLNLQSENLNKGMQVARLRVISLLNGLAFIRDSTLAALAGPSF